MAAKGSSCQFRLSVMVSRTSLVSASYSSLNLLFAINLDRDSFVNDILPSFDCIILGPGPGTPHSDQDFCWATRLIREYGSEVPILGICLGCQGLATAFGGKVSIFITSTNLQLVDPGVFHRLGKLPLPFMVRFRKFDIQETQSFEMCHQRSQQYNTIA